MKENRLFFVWIGLMMSTLSSTSPDQLIEKAFFHETAPDDLCQGKFTLYCKQQPMVTIKTDHHDLNKKLLTLSFPKAQIAPQAKTALQEIETRLAKARPKQTTCYRLTHARTDDQCTFTITYDPLVTAYTVETFTRIDGCYGITVHFFSKPILEAIQKGVTQQKIVHVASHETSVKKKLLT